MSNFKVKGSIASISEKKVLDNGASIVDYVVSVTSDNGYVTPHNFSMYKKAEYAEHVDNFIQFNKVGDVVEVEFTIRGQEYNGKIYNSLNHWRCDKVEMSESPAIEKVKNDLPF